MKFKFNVTAEKLQINKEMMDKNTEFDHTQKLKQFEVDKEKYDKEYQLRLAELDSFWTELIKLLKTKGTDDQTKEVIGKLIEAYIIERTKGSITPTVLTRMESNLHEIIDRVRTIDMATDLVEELKKIDVNVAKGTLHTMENQLRKEAMNKRLLADMLGCPECGWIIVNKEHIIIDVHQSTFEFPTDLFVEKAKGKNILMIMSEYYPLQQQMIITEAITCAFTGEIRTLNFAQYITFDRRKVTMKLGFYPFYGNGDITGVIILTSKFDDTCDDVVKCSFDEFELHPDIPKTEPEVSIPNVEQPEVNPENEGGEDGQ